MDWRNLVFAMACLPVSMFLLGICSYGMSFAHLNSGFWNGLAIASCLDVPIYRISYASCSVGRVLQSPKSLSLPAYIPSLAFNKKHQAWLRELENSAVIADLKLLNCSTHFALECMTTDCLCLTRQHDLL